jgi:hypothetical protein
LHRLGVREQVRLAGAEELVEPAGSGAIANPENRPKLAASSEHRWSLVVVIDGPR